MTKCRQRDLNKLPAEIVRMIMEYILSEACKPDWPSAHRPLRSRLSRLCMVSKEWAAALRPVLFNDLVVTNLSDIATLNSIIALDSARTMAKNIHEIRVEDNGDLQELPKMLHMISTSLPSIQTMVLGCFERQIHSVHLRVALMKFRSLQKLTINFTNI